MQVQPQVGWKKEIVKVNSKSVQWKNSINMIHSINHRLSITLYNIFMKEFNGNECIGVGSERDFKNFSNSYEQL